MFILIVWLRWSQVFINSAYHTCHATVGKAELKEETQHTHTHTHTYVLGDKSAENFHADITADVLTPQSLALLISILNTYHHHFLLLLFLRVCMIKVGCYGWRPSCLRATHIYIKYLSPSLFVAFVWSRLAAMVDGLLVYGLLISILNTYHHHFMLLLFLRVCLIKVGCYGCGLLVYGLLISILNTDHHHFLLLLYDQGWLLWLTAFLSTGYSYLY